MPVNHRGAFGTTDWSANWSNFDPQATRYDLNAVAAIRHEPRGLSMDSTGVSSDSLSDGCFLLINLSTDPIANEPSTKIKNELKINSLITNGIPIKPVTMSAQANKHIIKKAINPTTDFSLIELLSQNSCLKKFFIIFVF
jgi:hypothetical protein